MRPRQLRRRLLLVGLGGMVAAATITTGVARADGVLSHAEVAYVNTYHGAICKTLDKFPTEDGVVGIMTGIMQDGFTADDSVDIINSSVSIFCDEHWPLLQRIGREARGENQISQVWQS